MGSGNFIPPKARQQSGNVGLGQLPTFDAGYPIFCFKYLHPNYNFDNCKKDHKILKGFIDRIRMLSSMNWRDIQFTGRTASGSEKIARKSIKVSIPPVITQDVDSFISFYFAGTRGRMIGWREQSILHVLYLDPDFKVYDH
jgi:hypothetical protein